MRSNPVPRKIVTDQLRSYPAAKAEIAELANVKHVFVKAAARLNNRAENGHQPTRECERRMRGFRDAKRTQKSLSCFGPIRLHFALNRHPLRASLFRKQLPAQFVAWREMTEVTDIRPGLSDGCSFLPPFRLNLDKLASRVNCHAPGPAGSGSRWSRSYRARFYRCGHIFTNSRSLKVAIRTGARRSDGF
jgi:hypothetical protein